MSDEDSFTEITERGWLERAGSSFAGVIIGLLMFVASFPLLVWNEKRAVEAITALDAGARSVISVSSESVDPANEGRLVHVAGMTGAIGRLEDPVFRIGASDILRLERQVEMFQWREEEESTTEKSVGGKETTKTTYRYVKVWSDSQIDSSKFKRPEGHVNPTMPYRGQVLDARPVKLGAFTLDASQVRQIDSFEALPPVDVPLPSGFRWLGDSLYRGDSADNPRIGDLRVRFQVVRAQMVTVVAQQVGGALTAYHGAHDHVIDLVRGGAQSADAMFKAAKAEENALTWILRLVGFVLMLIGLSLLASPLAWLASVLPFLESIINGAAFIIALLLSLPLTLVTIALSWLAFRPLIGGGLLVAAVLLLIGLRKILPNRRRVAAVGGAAMPPMPPPRP